MDSFFVECYLFIVFFFFNDTATTEIYTLSLHDALPIYFNAVIIDLIEAVMHDSDREVIFVIQSDEGPFPKEIGRAHV